MIGHGSRLVLASGALLALVLGPRPGSAQQGMMAGDAMGQPLADGSLAAGTATVRVVRGSFLEPIVDVEVTVTPTEGVARIARTDNEGRATVAGLEPGVAYVASVLAEGKQAASQPFTMPASGGLRLALSTVAWKSAGHGTSPSDSSESPAKLAGRPQVLDSLAARLLVTRVVAGGSDRGIAGAQVHLVGYQADGQITLTTQTTSADGRAPFPGLTPRSVAYYALSIVHRDGGDDRLQSLPIIMADTAGTSLLLAGLVGDAASTADDLDRLYDDQPAPPNGPGPGEVVVRLAGRPGDLDPLEAAELFVVGHADQVARIPLAPAAPPPNTIHGRATRQMATQQPAGTLTVSVIYSDESRPLGGIPVEVLGEGGDIVGSGTSAEDGLVDFSDLDLTGSYRIALTVRGRRITTGTLGLPAESGVMVPIAVTWGPDQPTGKVGNIAWGADKVYVVRVTTAGGRSHYSPPFQLTAARGASVTIPVTTTPSFRFSLGGGLDNNLMRFQGMFFVHNDSFSPFDLGAGLKLPLPRGFIGAGVADQNQDRVKVVAGAGFVLQGALPPGGGEFHGGFALELDGGDLDFDLALPYGADRSNLRLVYLPGVEVKLSGNAQGEVGIDPRSGTQVYEVGDIDLGPGERLIMRVTGLPHLPGWHRQARIAIGVMAIALVGWAIAGCFVRRRGGAVDPKPLDRRAALLDQLTELERRHRAGNVAAARYQRSRDRLMSELEPLCGGRDRPLR